MNKELNLYQFFWECGRAGDLEGLFIADPEELGKSFGKALYFGEVLGKHSEVYGTLDEEDITLVSDDTDFVNKLRTIMKCENISGFNPLDYIEVHEDE